MAWERYYIAFFVCDNPFFRTFELLLASFMQNQAAH